MLLDFENMEETVIHNFNGGEKDTRAKMYNDENMRILYGVLEPGASIGIHEHTDNSEEVFCVSGQATVYIDGKTEILKAGQAHYCPKDRRAYNLRRCAKAIKTILKLNIVMVFGKIIS